MGDLSAGVVVIGNEILSGKVVDTNSPFLASELRPLGVTLRRITTIPDELPLIRDEVRIATTSRLTSSSRRAASGRRTTTSRSRASRWRSGGR